QLISTRLEASVEPNLPPPGAGPPRAPAADAPPALRAPQHCPNERFVKASAIMGTIASSSAFLVMSTSNDRSRMCKASPPGSRLDPFEPDSSLSDGPSKPQWPGFAMLPGASLPGISEFPAGFLQAISRGIPA